MVRKRKRMPIAPAYLDMPMSSFLRSTIKDCRMMLGFATFCYCRQIGWA